jgi:hypothetical protein
MIWKDIQGYEGLYQISKEGKFRKLENNNWIIKNLKTHPERRLQVYLSKDGKSKKEYLHLLVARHFLDNYSNSNRCGFKDGDINNCKVDNLYWL